MYWLLKINELNQSSDCYLKRFIQNFHNIQISTFTDTVLRSLSNERSTTTISLLDSNLFASLVATTKTPTERCVFIIDLVLFVGTQWLTCWHIRVLVGSKFWCCTAVDIMLHPTLSFYYLRCIANSVSQTKTYNTTFIVPYCMRK